LLARARASWINVRMARRERLGSVDLLRGAVMVLMALDHTRDFFSNAGVEPTDLAHSWPALFLTRWVTHFCAPVFVLLAGAGAYLSHRPRRDLQLFLVTRGLWLVLLEVTVVTFAWSFDPRFHFVALQVIWAIGWCMVGLAALVELPAAAVGAIGLVVIAAHNLTDGLAAGWPWAILHRAQVFEPFSGHRVRVAYPLLPWLGVIAAGYGLGAILDRPDRRRLLLAVGAALTLAFVLLRALGGYGDPHHFDTRFVLDFLNCTKYPPSLEYLLMTLGPALLVLAALDGRSGGPIAIFGRVPLFYYVLHLYLIHASRMAVYLIQKWAGSEPSHGWGLPVVYAVWIAIVVALYFPCRWYAGFKARRRDLAWLSYL
jgi:uncharacterized membrane protein